MTGLTTGRAEGQNMESKAAALTGSVQTERTRDIHTQIYRQTAPPESKPVKQYAAPASIISSKNLTESQ